MLSASTAADCSFHQDRLASCCPSRPLSEPPRRTSAHPRLGPGPGLASRRPPALREKSPVLPPRRPRSSAEPGAGDAGALWTPGSGRSGPSSWLTGQRRLGVHHKQLRGARRLTMRWDTRAGCRAKRPRGEQQLVHGPCPDRSGASDNTPRRAAARPASSTERLMTPCALCGTDECRPHQPSTLHSDAPEIV